ncbi:hypothetical protein N7528_003214 [Penicillium herquei]|nr:hypothetical protein N7528_003214 [Penicillium herquei]
MRSSRSVRVQRPPAPCVEEEPVSLARELHGLTKIGEKPGFEGICKRGTVDQNPIIMPQSPVPTSLVSTSPNPPGLGSVSSDDNSSGPRTPPPPMPEPVVRIVEPVERDIPAPPSVASRSQSRAPQRYQVPSQDQSPVRQPRPRSQTRSREFSRTEGSQHPRPSPDRSAVEQVSRGRDLDQHGFSSQKSPLARSKSLKTGPSTVQIVPSHPRSDSVTGYQSDSTMGTHSTRLERARAPTTSSSGLEKRQELSPSSQSRTGKSSARTLAERLEEKLRLREELRNLSSDSESEPSTRRRSRSISRKSIHAPPPREPSPPHEIVHAAPIQRAPSPPVEIVHAAPIQRAPEPQRYPPVSRGRSSTVSSTAPPPRSALRSSSRAHGSKSMSSDEAQASSSKPRRANSVKFLDDLPQRRSQTQTQLVTVPKTTSPQRAPSTLGLCVTPCPRSTPMSGFQDWYTLKGLTHLNICPSCMNQIGHSRFRDYFIPSLPNNGEKIQCAFGNAWTRLAWTQMIKKEHQSLEMLYQMTRPPPGTPECPGRHKVKNVWHRIIEPETKSYLPRLHVCTSCARNVRILMPSHRDTFQPDSRPEEGICAFVTTSPRFVQFIDLLDNAANHAKPSRRPDLREFLSYARRKIVLRDCQRDKPMRSGWHYMADLPELLACGDCYDEVVWPLTREKYALAEDFYPKMRYLPGDGPSRCRLASCSLYSPRMRAKFREAVLNDDFSGLKAVSLRRFEAERRFQDRKEELLDAEERGYRCDVEIRKAIEEWRRWE